MDIEEKNKSIALFRYGVISDSASISLPYGELERRIQEKSNQKWIIPFSRKTRVSASTIRSWLKRYQDSGGKLESLYPKGRNDQGKTRKFDEETATAILRMREEKPCYPVQVLIEELYERKVVPRSLHLSISTVRRFLNQHAKEPDDALRVDRRRFEAELPNDLWQSDVMHGPHVMIKGKKRKAYLIGFIDDHSRLSPYCRFYHSENTDCFLNAFKKALLSRGMPRKLYVDNGSAYRSNHLEFVTASLGIALIHAKPYTPQGKGKIERFFRTVRMQFLPYFKGDTLEDLNMAFSIWLEDAYHNNVHSSTGEKPLERFHKKVELLRLAPENITDHFRKKAKRRVTKDRGVSLDGRLYEAPLALIGKYVELLYHEDQLDKIEVLYKGKYYGSLKNLDPNVNYRVKRNPRGLEIESSKNSGIQTGELPF